LYVFHTFFIWETNLKTQSGSDMAQESQPTAYNAYASQCPSKPTQATAQHITWLQGERVGDQAWQQTFAFQVAHVLPKPPQVAPTTAEHYLHKQTPNAMQPKHLC
jgi:hypothetical protein